jgi:aspartate 4-decarboxylase
LQINRLLKRGDKIAIGAPIFTPYIEMPTLDQYGLEIVRIDACEMRADGLHSWQYPDSEIDKLADPAIKAFFLVNPSNPPSAAVRQSTIDRIIGIVEKKNPNLIIITDDVYGTFVDGFRSLMADLPHNTIGVYSYSKYFGCTGWRLGVVAVHEDNIYDKMIAALPAADKKALAKRYGSLTLEPEKMKFIDRMVADSRRVALNHTAGLSLPQQVQMMLFSLFCLTDKTDAYKKLTRRIVAKRMEKFWEGFHAKPPVDALRANYYSTVDILIGADQALGQDFCDYMKRTYEPVDILIRLAEQYGTVLLNGSGFDGPLWSVRCSLANLPDEAYAKIGGQLEAVVRGYADEWRKAKAKK